MPQDDAPITPGLESAGEAGVDRFAHFVVERLPDGQLDCIGRGGMGLTYRARDTQLDRLVALKIISPQWVDDAEVRSRFSREARAAARLQHPNIASVLYQGVEGAACFYAMELVVGETLESYIKRNGPLAPVHALRLAHQVALALVAAAREGVLHRDLKPGNVMLTSYDDSGAPHAKVIDFGLAKVLSDTGVSCVTGGFLGTPEFASPEQCAEEPLDFRSDLYSLGATLWFMLAGRPPFTGSVLSLMKAHAGEPPPFEDLGGLPAPLHTLLARLLAKSPDDRPSTPAEAAREIEAVLAQLSAADANFEPLDVAPASTITRSPSRPAAAAPPRRSSLLLIGSIATAVVAIGAALYFAGRSSAPQAAAPAQPVAPTPSATAAPDAPYTNSLGMKFVPVPGENFRISVWETRVRDFAAFVTAANYKQADQPNADGRTWRQPGFAQGDDHPVVFVSVEDARAFCDWLTRTERAAGRIAANEAYRLPRRPEWDSALGFRPPEIGGRGRREGPRSGEPPPFPGPQPGEAPPQGERPPPPREDGGGGPPFLWGTHTWPPSAGAGNFGDQTAAQMTHSTIIQDYQDGFARTAPVGQFAAGSHGIFDLAGNVWELILDGSALAPFSMILGGSWQSAAQSDLRAHAAVPLKMTERKPDVGFRCVLGATR